MKMQSEEFDSPIEYRFYNHVIKFLNQEVSIIPQYEVNTVNGDFRVDFVLRLNDHLIGIECDGQDHHFNELDEWYDEWRDILIVTQSNISCIYRLSGSDLIGAIPDVIFLLSRCEPEFFNNKAERIKPLLRNSTSRINFDDPEDFKSSAIVLLNSFREKGKVSILKRPIRDILSNTVYRKFIYFSFKYPHLKVRQLVDFYLKSNTSNDDFEDQILALRKSNKEFDALF